MMEDFLLDLPNRLDSHYKCFMDLMILVEPGYSEKVKQAKVQKKEEKIPDEENEDAGDEPEGEEDPIPVGIQPSKKEEPEGLVLGLVTTDIETEREVIKNKFLEKINSLRAKRNAPPVQNISELKESGPPKKRQKREKSLSRKQSQNSKKSNPATPLPHTEEESNSRKRSVDKFSGKKNFKNPELNSEDSRPLPHLKNSLNNSLNNSLKNSKSNLNNSANSNPKSKKKMIKKSKSESDLSLASSDNSIPKSRSSIEFSKIEFSSDSSIPTYMNKRKPSKTQLLKKVEAKKQRLEQLQNTDEGKMLASKMAWDTMKKRASGEKVKDDPKKLKKTIKREQSQKRKSQKEWKKRKQLQNKAIKDKQQRYEDNQKKNRDRKIAGKNKKVSRPGFEGKKKEFIN